MRISLNTHNLAPRLAFGLLWLFVFSNPWERLLIASGATYNHLIGIVALVITVLLVMARRRLRPWRRAHWFMVAFLGWATLSLFWTPDFPMSLAVVVIYLQLGAQAWLLWELAPTEEAQTSLLVAYVLGTAVSALAILSTVRAGLTTTQLYGGERYAMGGTDPNELGLTLALSLPMSWYLLTRRHAGRRPWWTAGYLGLFFLALVGVLLTASRGAVLATLAALLIVPLSLSRLSPGRRLALVLGLLGVACAVRFLVPQGPWQRLVTTYTSVREMQLSGREEIWPLGIQMFWEHPFFGVGTGAFAAAIEEIYYRAVLAHNTFLSILVENGLVGFALFTGLMIALVSRLRRLPVARRNLWAVLLLTWAIGVFGLTWLARKPTWLLFGLLAAQATPARREAPAAAGELAPPASETAAGEQP